jgi:hypothetical protein
LFPTGITAAGSAEYESQFHVVLSFKIFAFAGGQERDILLSRRQNRLHNDEPRVSGGIKSFQLYIYKLAIKENDFNNEAGYNNPEPETKN